MLALFVVAVGAQGLAMLVDEFVFHRARGLPKWERIGHPLDTLTLVGCLVWLLATSPSQTNLGVYIALSVFSTLFVTKDEFVHAKLCGGGEQWLHSVLFVLHPIVLFAFGAVWWTGYTSLLIGQLVVTLAFLAYQVIYWNVVRGEPRVVNNAWYADLGARWYVADDTPIALLRAESRHRNPWIASEIEARLGPGPHDVLDLGCGAGFLSNYLGARGHRVTGIDTTPENLVVAKHHDGTGQVTYEPGDATALRYPNSSFDVVCAMDLLEHVEEPGKLISEAGRVLRPGGVLIFHTFNRNWLANIIVIKGVEWFVKNTPKDLHVLRLFRTPAEVAGMLASGGLDLVELRGARPRFRWPLFRMLLTGRVGDDFSFTFTPSTKIGFTGIAQKDQRRLTSMRVTPDTRGSDSGERPSLPPSP
ncbi:MAG TPA: bifunctional 2-polyprenyl-6-hydroxyphenol methylase/3-demethylubiquinol 3-O-methyltransferase UbiG [Kofleriaceae bacterium]|nr:bifunctional 2-polyprenyl-6-hydroxyphenol methylase/3-demethylubiquinol 3-O-methyltransferase UbiG [Kofleriaceae bacterium]